MSKNAHNVNRIIDLFGGVRPMSQKLGIPVSKIQEWKDRGQIPASRLNDILEAAQEFDMARTVGEHVIHLQQEYQDEIDARRRDESMRERLKREKFRKSQLHYDLSYWIKSSVVGGSLAVGMFAVLFILFFAPDFLPNMIKGMTASEAPKMVTMKDFEDVDSTETFQEKLAMLEQQNEDLRKNIKQYDDFDLDTVSNPFFSAENSKKRIDEIFSSVSTETEELAPLATGLQTIQKSVEGNDKLQMVYGMSKVFLKRFDTVADKTGFDRVLNSREVQQIAAKVNTDDVKAAALLLATAQLRGTLGRETSFEEDLDTLRELVKDDPELVNSINRLEPYAEKGLSGREVLNQHLSEMAEDVIAMKYKGNTSASINNPILRKINEELNIDIAGKITDVNEENPIVVIANAQNHLENGDVVSATQEMLKIKGPAAILAEPFIEKSRGYIEASGLMGRLTREVGTIVQSSGYDLTE